jgi:uridine phosphorylase
MTGEAIINPRRHPGEEVTERVVLTFAPPDYRLLCRLAQVQEPSRQIWDCRFQKGSWQGQPLTVVAPAVGAPYAVIVMENLIARGARLFLALGWCGALLPQVKMGGLVLPTTARAGEGTSRYYGREGDWARPHPGLCGKLRAQIGQAGVPWHAGPVWTTDAFYRETVDLVRHCQKEDILGIEMEMAALFAVGAFRQVPVAGLLVVSDELSSLEWRVEYRSPAFLRAREEAARLILDAAAAWSLNDA